MSDPRPRHINPLAIRLPITAWISIAHRISGVLLLLALPFLEGVWTCSLSSPEAYEGLLAQIRTFPGQWMIALLGLAWFYHVLAGLRHLIMDLGYGTSRTAAVRSAQVIGCAIVSVALFLLIRTF